MLAPICVVCVCVLGWWLGACVCGGGVLMYVRSPTQPGLPPPPFSLNRIHGHPYTNPGTHTPHIRTFSQQYLLDPAHTLLLLIDGTTILMLLTLLYSPTRRQPPLQRPPGRVDFTLFCLVGSRCRLPHSPALPLLPSRLRCVARTGKRPIACLLRATPPVCKRVGKGGDSSASVAGKGW